MNKLQRILVAGGCATMLALGAGNLHAQGRGNFDPAQMRQRMMDRLRDEMGIKDDAEWQAIEPKISKVMDARRDIMGMEMSGFGRRRDRGGDDNNGDQSRRRGGFFGEPSPSIEALHKAIDDKAPKDEIKAKLAAVHAEYKAKRAVLEAAQSDLRSVLTTRQEAVATADGLLID